MEAELKNAQKATKALRSAVERLNKARTRANKTTGNRRLKSAGARLRKSWDQVRAKLHPYRTPELALLVAQVDSLKLAGVELKQTESAIELVTLILSRSAELGSQTPAGHAANAAVVDTESVKKNWKRAGWNKRLKRVRQSVGELQKQACVRFGVSVQTYSLVSGKVLCKVSQV